MIKLEAQIREVGKKSLHQVQMRYYDKFMLLVFRN